MNIITCLQHVERYLDIVQNHGGIIDLYEADKCFESLVDLADTHARGEHAFDLNSINVIEACFQKAQAFHFKQGPHVFTLRDANTICKVLLQIKDQPVECVVTGVGVVETDTSSSVVTDTSSGVGIVDVVETSPGVGVVTDTTPELLVEIETVPLCTISAESAENPETIVPPMSLDLPDLVPLDPGLIDPPTETETKVDDVTVIYTSDTVSSFAKPVTLNFEKEKLF